MRLRFIFTVVAVQKLLARPSALAAMEGTQVLPSAALVLAAAAAAATAAKPELRNCKLLPVVFFTLFALMRPRESIR